MVNPERSLCQEKNANSHICEAYFDKEHIRFIGFESGAYTTTQNANSLSLGTDALVLVHYVQ